MSTKVMFTVVAAIDGELTRRKLNDIASQLATTLSAVAMPESELTRARNDDNEKIDVFNAWHVHQPSEDACEMCIDLSTTQLAQQ